MTLPNERRMAILRTEEFLSDLLRPRITPRVPMEIRKRALECLRHYPSSYDMACAKKIAPTIFGEWDSEYTRDK